MHADRVQRSIAKFYGGNLDPPSRGFGRVDIYLATVDTWPVKEHYITDAAQVQESSNKLAALPPGVLW